MRKIARSGFTHVVLVACGWAADAHAYAKSVGSDLTPTVFVVPVGFGRSARPKSRATVMVTAASGGVVGVGTTGLAGVVRLARPAAGVYRISVEVENHESVTELAIPESGTGPVEVRVPAPP